MIWGCVVWAEYKILKKIWHQEDERKMGKEKVYLDKNFLIKHVSLIVLLPTREILMCCLLMFLSWQNANIWTFCKYYVRTVLMTRNECKVHSFILVYVEFVSNSFVILLPCSSLQSSQSSWKFRIKYYVGRC